MLYSSTVTLSIIMPCFNEENTVIEIIRKVLAQDLVTELIIVNDGSTDRTLDNIKKIFDPRIKLLSNSKNYGKGYSVRQGIKLASGDIIGIQDADLEYDPREYTRLVKPIVENHADVVFGTRFQMYEGTRILYYSHYIANRFLTNITNIFTNLNMSDMETCYKFFSREAIKTITLKQNKFGIEPEIAIKLAANNFRFFEVPISYNGRTYQEGKKIKFKDGIFAIWVIVKEGIYSKIKIR